MMKLYSRAIAAAALLLASAAQAQAITTDRAREIDAPFYATFTQPVAGDVKALLEKATSADWQSCAADNECRGREQSVTVYLGLSRVLPNIRNIIKDVVVEGNVVVRGELSGAPVGESFGVAHAGRSLSIMTMDRHARRDGRLKRTYHVEDLAAATRQLAKP